MIALVAVSDAVLAVVAIHDVAQRRHATQRNFPIIEHLRYLLEMLDDRFGAKTVAEIFGGRGSGRPIQRTDSMVALARQAGIEIVRRPSAAPRAGARRA